MADGTAAGPVNVTATHPSTMAADRLTADLSTMKIDVRLPNFPLPRELRDMVYTYLLDGDHTRIPRKFDQVTDQNLKHNRTGPKAYHFHTNILAVNHEIHAETEELLYKRNTFVVVSYQWPSLGVERGDLLWVPIVSTKHVPRMTLHSLRIHVDPGAEQLQLAALTHASVPIESYIILARDIKAFCVTMHVSTESYHAAPAVLINPGARFRVTGIGRENTEDGQPTRFKCQLRDTRYRQMDRALQNYLLAPLASVVGMSQKVSFTGTICDPQQTEHLKRVMGPTLVCLNALFWFMYEESELAKEVADATVEHDDLDFVVYLYRVMSNRLSKRLFSIIGSSRASWMMPPYIEMLMAIDRFTVELLLNLACGELKLQQMSAFTRTCNQLQKILHSTRNEAGGSWALSRPLLDRHFSTLIYRHIYEACREDDPLPLVSVGQAAQLAYVRCTGGVGSHLAHDREILINHPAQDECLSAKHLPLDKCAAVCLQFIPTSFYRTIEGGLKKGLYQGFQDVESLRNLSSDVKKQIRAMQEENGIEKTDFSKL
jgi:hypothetical protein